VNSSPYEGAWLVKVKLANPSQVDQLMSAEEYDALLATLSH
jgi:glycine cleavage system H protein